MPFAAALLSVLALAQAAFAVVPRSGYVLVPGAEDLLQTGQWQCISSVQSDPEKLIVTAGADYNTVINTTGRRLSVEGDFSVLADLSTKSGTAYLTLVGSLATSPWWNGLKRLDAGVAGQSLSIVYWTGGSANATGRSFRLPAPADDPGSIEVARIGQQLVFFAGSLEVGRIDDPGIFAEGKVYLGFNAAPGSELWVLGLAAAAPAGTEGAAAVQDPFSQIVARDGSGLRDAAEARGFLVGAAVGPPQLTSSGYAGVLGREFNLIVAENVMKFAAIHPARDRYNFCFADQLVAFASANGARVRGHTLVWHDQIPAWVTRGNFSREELIAILRDHITTVMSHFKGKLIAWDVVNEAISYSPPYGPQDSFWLRGIGPEYIDMAFRWAREADPDVKLFYNETGAEAPGNKANRLFELIAGLQSRGVPLDGVGLQMHLDLDAPVSGAAVSQNLRRLAAVGLEAQITEMDVRIKEPVTPEKLDRQATVYRDVLRACLDSPNCSALLTWGVSDAASWIPGFYQGYDAGLLFDRQFQPKPAYRAVAEELAAR